MSVDQRVFNYRNLVSTEFSEISFVLRVSSFMIFEIRNCRCFIVKKVPGKIFIFTDEFPEGFTDTADFLQNKISLTSNGLLQARPEHAAVSQQNHLTLAALHCQTVRFREAIFWLVLFRL
jgi:hypothetical protein